jgi:uncharacterized protein (DUF427 family)
VARNAVWAYPEPIASAAWLAGYVAFYWNRMDAWLEEAEEVIAHPRDPYHRVDAIRSDRHVVVRVDGQVVAESRHPVLVFETGLPTRYYLPAEDVRTDLLQRTDTRTQCPYKGNASYWTLRTGAGEHADLVWSYAEPFDALTRIAGLLAFFDERADVELDGVAQERPITRWSRGNPHGDPLR